ncbi:lipoprotein NlpI [Anaerobiospirillum sp. NML120449]|uniref:lipoprotein NlpI n=1 Tax=Anaerobiospirillum sp. NML120449 TaxID=2932817 RepID=UPI001FF57F12|nr:lipoprotein NlpI [Anaerobiospirillum sp. NML120449]MCK0526484.1 hypothetical protein [Anaerobiospirillum sp. NML120449]
MHKFITRRLHQLLSQGLKLSVLAMAVYGLSGCTVNNGGPFTPALDAPFSIDKDETILVLPDAAEREQYQMLLTQFTAALANPGITREQKAQLLYQLGIIYDRLGLDVTARNMFLNALVEVPDFPQAYNFLGIYLASAERFAEAYDAYDSVLELDPKEKFAWFNRGIALYYGGRSELGITDLLKFYEFDKNDPFRIAWLYILERDVYGEEYATEKIIERRNAIDKKVPWGLEVLDFLSGKLSSKKMIADLRKAAIDNVERGRRLCEAYFYMAKLAQFEGQYKRAYDLFHLSMATSVTGYLEYRYAMMEIMRLKRFEAVAIVDTQAKEQQRKRNEQLEEQADEAHRYFEAQRKLIDTKATADQPAFKAAGNAATSNTSRQSSKQAAQQSSMPASQSAYMAADPAASPAVGKAPDKSAANDSARDSAKDSARASTRSTTKSSAKSAGKAKAKTAGQTIDMTDGKAADKTKAQPGSSSKNTASSNEHGSAKED